MGGRVQSHSFPVHLYVAEFAELGILHIPSEAEMHCTAMKVIAGAVLKTCSTSLNAAVEQAPTATGGHNYIGAARP